MAVELLSFDGALRDAEQQGAQPHVLLGNGFSIACRADRFTYGALLEEATFDGASVDLRAVFEMLGTTDFERVIELLRVAAEICEGYGTSDSGLTARLYHDVEVVRSALAHVLAARHPDVPFDITDDEYESARRFLAHFNKIYTLNYDMLLYWTVMQDSEPIVARNDGFGNPDDPEAPYVAWQPYVTYDWQRLFYLHGSLHLYDSGTELCKMTWSRTQVPLVEQIRDALAEGRYPLIVTEGTSAEKITKILHSAYLNHAIRSFARIGGSLFLYGLSLAPNDEHLLRRINEGRTSVVYVSLFGDPDSDANQLIIERARRLPLGRTSARPLRVAFYDAESARVWR